MGVAIAAIGALFGVLGLIGLVAPQSVSRSLDSFKSSPGKIYGWAGVRVLMGVILMLGASSTALPALIRVIGAVLILKASLVPLMGLEKVRSILGQFQAHSPLLMRILFLLVASFGAFLVWAALRP